MTPSGFQPTDTLPNDDNDLRQSTGASAAKSGAVGADTVLAMLMNLPAAERERIARQLLADGTPTLVQDATQAGETANGLAFCPGDAMKQFTQADALTARARQLVNDHKTRAKRTA